MLVMKRLTVAIHFHSMEKNTMAIINWLVSAVKWLITINRIQNKSFCLHNICVCAEYIYYVYVNTHTYSIYFENVYIYINIIYIIYKSI